MYKYKIKKSNVVAITVILFIIITYGVIRIISTLNEKNISFAEEMVINEAKAHFDNMVMARSWNAKLGGVYILKSDSIEPNPYLMDNHIFSSDNKMLVKVNPAWMTRQISELSNKSSNYYYKITSLNPLNPNNEPDSFESKALQVLEKDPNQKYYYEFNESDKKFNFMGALKVEPACMPCHQHQGYSVGDNRGGIRVSMPLNAFYTNLEDSYYEINLLYIIIILSSIFALAIILFAIDKIFAQQNKLEDSNSQLQIRVAEEVEKNKKLFEETKHVSMAELITNLAHQWRQPLSTISTAASGIKVEKEFGTLDEEKLNAKLNVIVDTTQKLSTTIKDLENIFNAKEECEDIILYSLIDNGINLLQERIEKIK